jgi:hypothetical protein
MSQAAQTTYEIAEQEHCSLVEPSVERRSIEVCDTEGQRTPADVIWIPLACVETCIVVELG